MFCTMSIYVRVPPRIEIIICRFQRWSRAVCKERLLSTPPFVSLYVVCGLNCYPLLIRENN